MSINAQRKLVTLMAALKAGREAAALGRRRASSLDMEVEPREFAAMAWVIEQLDVIVRSHAPLDLREMAEDVAEEFFGRIKGMGISTSD
jgi:hypothetical protein